MESFWFAFGLVWFLLGVISGRFVFAMVGAFILIAAFWSGVFSLFGA